MQNRWIGKHLLLIAALLLIFPLAAGGCDGDGELSSSQPAPMELSSTLVPDVPLDLYVYGKQEMPTRVPLSLVPVQDYVEVESVAVWGVPAENDFAIGMCLTMESAQEASEIYSLIPEEGEHIKSELWKDMVGNVIYLVYGDGPAAESLKNAISDNSFKQYDAERALKFLSAMPDSEETRLAGVAVAEPTDELIGFMNGNAGNESLDMLRTIMKLGRFEVVAAGVYSPDQIDMVEMVSLLDNPEKVEQMQAGMMVMTKSGYPSLVVEPVVGVFLRNNQFTENKINGLTIYKGSWEAGNILEVPVLVRIEGNCLYAVLCGQESYGQALLTGIKK